ncbi:MAG: hypothetical protein HPY81_01815 [Firmicutes bacterium]|nr:hypothetical protein [Bacillota bacterium]
MGNLSGRVVTSEGGYVLVIALFVLSLVFIVGSTLLFIAQMEERIAINYQNQTVCLYLAEAGLERVRLAINQQPSLLNADNASQTPDYTWNESVSAGDWLGQTEAKVFFPNNRGLIEVIATGRCSPGIRTIKAEIRPPFDFAAFARDNWVVDSHTPTSITINGHLHAPCPLSSQLPELITINSGMVRSGYYFPELRLDDLRLMAQVNADLSWVYIPGSVMLNGRELRPGHHVFVEGSADVSGFLPAGVVIVATGGLNLTVENGGPAGLVAGGETRLSCPPGGQVSLEALLYSLTEVHLEAPEGAVIEINGAVVAPNLELTTRTSDTGIGAIKLNFASAVLPPVGEVVKFTNYGGTVASWRETVQ